MTDLVKKLLVYTNSNILVQFFRYAIVGGVAAVADISVYHIAVKELQLNYVFAKIISFVVGLLVNYLLSSKWVFNKYKSNFARDFLLFAIIGVIGLGLSIAILYILIDCRILYILMPVKNEIFIKDIANLAAIFLVLFWNFVARKKIVFDVK